MAVAAVAVVEAALPKVAVLLLAEVVFLALSLRMFPVEAVFLPLLVRLFYLRAIGLLELEAPLPISPSIAPSISTN